MTAQKCLECLASRHAKIVILLCWQTRLTSSLCMLQNTQRKNMFTKEAKRLLLKIRPEKTIAALLLPDQMSELHA
uniref:Putative secreted protein n=1 Tax=Ixodes ricinus TaxID=34613 RepID=A0A6B0U1Z2_IXORI